MAEVRESRRGRRQERNLIRILDTFTGDKEVYRKGDRKTETHTEKGIETNRQRQREP